MSRSLMWQRELGVAEAAVRAAGVVVREAWERGRPASESKGNTIDLVTAVDRQAEEVVVELIREAFPDDAMRLEEGGEQAGGSGRCWHVDPLDGTTNFAHGFPQFAVTAALEVEGAPVVGVTFDVTRGDLYRAAQGLGATVNGRDLSVSDTDDLGRALLATGFPYDRWENPDNNVGEFEGFLNRCRGVRRAGAAALDLAFVARGWLDGYWEMRLNSWDVAAGVLLVREAGGRCSDYRGRPLRLDGSDYVASNARIHESMLSLLEHR